MSGFFVFIVIIIAWAVFGSLKAAADKVGRNPVQPKPIPVNKNDPPRQLPPSRIIEQAPERRTLKWEDRLPDFGDAPEVREKKHIEPVKKVEVDLKKEPIKKEHQVNLTPLFKGDRLAEAIILAECLDKPRAYRPHPLNKQQNLLQRRG